MHTDRGEEHRISFRKAYAGLQIRWTFARSNRDNPFDPGVHSALNHFIAVGVKIGTVQVAMGVDQHTISSAPPLALPREIRRAPASHLRAKQRQSSPATR